MRRFVVHLLFVLLLGPALAAQVTVTATAARKILLLSDTQSPMWIETLLLPKHENDKARDMILTAVASDSAVSAVVHLGDITESASDESAWKVFERFAEALQARRIPLYPAIGNHEYMLNAARAARLVRAHFPWLDPTWYSTRIGGVALVILNSNRGELPQEQWDVQETWYRHTLEQLDRDSTVAVIIVGCHHPPYTNSTVVDPSKDVQRAFVPPYLRSRKARLFVSGHAHASEHFVRSGKNFLVLGGGGGLLQPLLTGSNARWKDLFPFALERRFFHYVECIPEAGALVVRVRMLKRNFSSIGAPYWFRIPYQAEGASAR